MASRKSPLRDRLLSNSPDPMKSSILRESGMGWNSPPTGSISSATSNGSITSPLRIAKRDSPGRSRGADVARRTSSSFRHVRNNNLVSKSPFKSQIPTPSTPTRTPLIFPTRRVSGEKRPRPHSIHDQAETENDRPFALKRDRKQSKGFQGLIDKEPVTKSPFKIQQHKPSDEPHPPPIPSRPISMPNMSTEMTLSLSARSISPNPTPTTVDTRPSPGRSSLVSRRMHGPRLSGDRRRERRKTVTFDERCDVVEFDREDSEEAMESDEGRYGSPELELSHDMQDEDGFFQGQTSQMQPHETADIQYDNDEPIEAETSYESIQLSDHEPSAVVPSLFDPDSSITGLVDQIFSSAGANSTLDSSITSTPPRHSDIPTDLETEDGVPFGRSHHIERFLQHHQEHNFINLPQAPIQSPHFSPHGSPHNSLLIHGSPHQHGSPGQGFPFGTASGSRSSPRTLPVTPPHRQSPVPNATPPLGRSTHTERIIKARAEEKIGIIEDDFDKLPESPSPKKKHSETGRISTIEESLVPRFELPGGIHPQLDSAMGNDNADPFSYSSDRNRGDEDLSTVKGDESMDPANLSIGNSEVSLSRLLRDSTEENQDHALNVDTETDNVSSKSRDVLPTGQRPSLPASCSTESLTLPSRIGSPIGGSPRFGSPLARAISPISHPSPPLFASTGSSQSPQSGALGRQRITREDVKRRLLHRRSFGSPGPDGEEPAVASPSQRSQAPSPATSEVVDIRVDESEASPETQYRSTDDKEKDRMSVMTTMTDFSTEAAIIQSAQKVSLDRSVGSLVEAENALLAAGDQPQVYPGRNVDAEVDSISSRDSLGIISRHGDVKVGSMNSTESLATGSVKMGDVDVNVDMKSALDRLMDDVAGVGASGCPDDSMVTDEFDESYDNESNEYLPRMQHDHKDFGGLLSMSAAERRDFSASSTVSLRPPPVPPKDNIKAREQLILEKRREARRMEEEDSDAPPSPTKAKQFHNLGMGRPSRRRSLSTGDAETIGGGAKKRGDALLEVKEVIEDDPLADSIERELKKLVEERPKSKYQVREREGTIYASSSEDRISHTTGAGDLDAGKAWRTVRRPSDMNEYSKQIKEYRAQQNPGKAYGKVFVKVVGVKGIHLPLPSQPTIMTCTLNNGIHFVTTPECQLGQESRIDQEFELIEHSKLEFTLTLKVRRDPHIIAQYKALAPAPTPAPPPPQPVVVQPPSRSGMRSFFSSSPKKSSRDKIVVQPPQPPPPQAPQRLPENLARYLKPDGTLARAFISFKDVATRCDTRLFETSYPLIGQRVEIGGKFSTLQAGELVLQIFRLPPLPGIPPEELPQSLEECVRGLRHLNWHKVTYFQGTLTQIGGDCSTWRRRQLRVIGSNLVAFNDVTKKATATIDLKKALAVEDDQEGARGGRGSRYADDYDGLYGVERSFRLIFPQNQEIVFFADTDEEKSRWLEILRALVGHIPPHPLWGELLWQRQEELLKRAQSPS